MNLRQRRDELRLALILLTRLPAGRIGTDAPRIDAAAWAFPLIGLPVGAVGGAALWAGAGMGLAPLAAALIALAAMALATGALHHDGLADFADGIGGGRDREHCLEIMRDSRIGSYGTLMLIFAISLQAAALSSAPVSLAAILLIAVASRVAMLGVLCALPPARRDGLGRMAAGPRPDALWPGAVLMLMLALLAGAPSLWVIPAAAIGAGLVALTAWRRIGGQTGDILGAAQMAAETAGWLALAAAAS